MYEELMNYEETRRAWELSQYFVVLPAFTSSSRNIVYEYPDVVSEEVKIPYHSGNEAPLAQNELKDFLHKNNLLEEAEREPFHPAERYWPD